MADATRKTSGDGSVVACTYALTTADHTGTAINTPEWGRKSVQFAGTWGGGTAVLEGSNDGTNYVTLRDPQGISLSFTGDGLKQVLEDVSSVRPRLSVVGSGCTVTATCLVLRANPMRT